MTWKRIQTLFMGVAALLILVTLGSDMCYTVIPSENHPGQTVRFAIRFTESLQFLLLSILSLLIAFLAVFGYRHRILQIRLCIVDSVVLFCYQIWIAVEFFRMKDVYTFTIFSIFPILAAILLLISIRFTWLDEARYLADKAFFNYAAGRKKNGTENAGALHSKNGNANGGNSPAGNRLENDGAKHKRTVAGNGAAVRPENEGR